MVFDLKGLPARAVASASCAIEDWGALGLLRATREETKRRRQEWFGMEART